MVNEKNGKKKSIRKSIKIGFVVNSIDSIKIVDSVLLMTAMTATNRGHEVYFMGVGDLFYSANEIVHAKACSVKGNKYDSTESYLKEIKENYAEKNNKINVADLDILMLRNDPSLEPPERAWARTIALDFGMLATKHGVIVLNSPGGLSKSRNKLYLQHFPEDIRVKTVITRDRDEIRKFFNAHKKVVLKPLSGSEGRNVFLVHNKEIPNLNQMIDAVSRDGYVIAQEYIPKADAGDIRLFVMNGEPLFYKGKYAIFKRMKAKGDMRNNISVGGKPKKAKMTKDILRIVDIVRPRLVQDGMFLVGIDIVGDKILEINVFCPGGFENIRKLEEVDFSEAVVDALERKVEYMAYYKRKFDNNEMATL